MGQKLEILYQRDLYVLAINLAQKAGVDDAQRNAILRKYGDYLHKKGDYDTAMQQYLKAIDNTEPSQVIRKVGFPQTTPIRNVDSCSLVVPRFSKDQQSDRVPRGAS